MINQYGQGLLSLLASKDTPNIAISPSYNFQQTLPVVPRRLWQDIYKFDWNINANNRVSFHLLRYHNNYSAYAGATWTGRFIPIPTGNSLSRSTS